jgi:hypothetical protein
MIFPNRAPSPQLRPGMGYSSGAFHRLGYVAHMGYAPGSNRLGSLGASYGNISPTMVTVAEEDGIADSDMQLLGSVGATDQDIENLVNGNVTLSQLYAQYGVTIAPTSTGTAATSPAAAPATTPAIAAASAAAASASAAQVPPGSTLLYTAQYNPVSGWTTSSQAIAALSPLLPSHGMSLLSSTVAASGLISNASFSVTILDSIGNNLVSDAKSVLDALMNQITNNGLQQSSLTVVSQGTTAAGASAAATTPATDPAMWLESNALWIALGIGGIILLNNMTGGKKR